MKRRYALGILHKLGIEVAYEAGDWITCHCPFAPWLHANGADLTPSFGLSVNDAGSSGFHCFACKQSGSALSLLTKLEGYRGEKIPIMLDILEAEADTVLPDFDSLAVEPYESAEPLNEAMYDGFFADVREHKQAKSYLVRRGIKGKTCDKLGLLFDTDEQRIVFPVRNQRGQLFGFTGRSILEKDAFPYNGYAKIRDYAGLPKRLMLLGSEFVRPDVKGIALVEGLFAYAHFHQIGADRIIQPVATLGSNLHEVQASMLIDWGKPVFVFYDPDQAGMDGVNIVRKKLASDLPVFLPDLRKDPDYLSFEELKVLYETSQIL